MSGRILDWLVGKWQWPYAALFTAGFLGLLAPLVFRYAGIPLGLVYLQLPIYMLHQYEEHAGDRFRLWVNNMLGHGRDVLTPIATFWINSLLVWLLDLVALYLACFVDLSLGLIAIYLPMLNAFGHIVPAIFKRQYNPGLLTRHLHLPAGRRVQHVSRVSRRGLRIFRTTCWLWEWRSRCMARSSPTCAAGFRTCRGQKSSAGGLMLGV